MAYAASSLFGNTFIASESPPKISPQSEMIGMVETPVIRQDTRRASHSAVILSRRRLKGALWGPMELWTSSCNNVPRTASNGRNLEYVRGIDIPEHTSFARRPDYPGAVSLLSRLDSNSYLVIENPWDKIHTIA